MEASFKDADTLSTLTSEQALADFATLVTDLKRNLSAEASPVVLFGGSYGGSRSPTHRDFFLLFQCGLHLCVILMADVLFRIFLYPFVCLTVLAAWMRLKYPHIAIGAVAASAPILQFEDFVPSDTFYRIVSADFKVILFLLLFFYSFFYFIAISLSFQCLVLESLDVFAARKYELFRLHPTIVGCHRQDCFSKWWPT